MANTYGILFPPPSWYPANLPLFYRDSGNNIILRPLNSVPNYTANDILDCCLYLQTIIGYNRTDWQNAKPAAWKYSDGSGSAQMWVSSAFKQDANGTGAGNFAAINSNRLTVDGAFYAQLQNRYIANEAKTKPWLAAMQAVGGGIELMTIPSPLDIEIPRPSFYAPYLPSLFLSGGTPWGQKTGLLTTKPTIKNGISSGYKQYTITPTDVAMLMLYSQPVIALGPTPYPVNWYINDYVNGALADYFKISLDFTTAHTNEQMQAWGINGDMMVLPTLDANPFASGFTLTLQTVVSAAISYFTSKIPGGTTLTTAATTISKLGGAAITGGTVPPEGTFSASVFAAADELAKSLQSTATNTKYVLLALAALAGVYYLHEEGYL